MNDKMILRSQMDAQIKDHNQAIAQKSRIKMYWVYF